MNAHDSAVDVVTGQHISFNKMRTHPSRDCTYICTKSDAYIRRAITTLNMHIHNE